MRPRHSISLKDFLPEGEDTKFMNVEEILLVAKRRMHAQFEAGEARGLVARAKSGCSTAFGQLYEYRSITRSCARFARRKMPKTRFDDAKACEHTTLRHQLRRR